MDVVREGLEEGLDHGGRGRVDCWIESVGCGVDFVATGVEVGREGGDAREEVGEEGV